MDVLECWRAMYQAACEYEAMNEVRARLADFLSERTDTFHRNIAIARTAEQARDAQEEPSDDEPGASMAGRPAADVGNRVEAHAPR
jgi:hypothetical protein